MKSTTDKIIPFCDKAAVVLMCLVIFDAGVFGAGRVINIGPLGFRQCLLLLLGVVCIPLLIKRFDNVIKDCGLWLLVVYAVWLVFQLVRGIMNHNTLLNVDISGYIYYLFYPLALVVLTDKNRVKTVMKTIVWSSAVLSVIVIALFILYSIDQVAFLNIASYGLSINFSRLGVITQSLPRIYMLSGLYMIAGFLFSMYFVIVEREQGVFKVVCHVVPAFGVFASMLSFTRSVYLAFFVGVAIVVIAYLLLLSKQQKKILIGYLVAVAAETLLIIAMFSLLTNTNSLEYAFSRLGVTFTGLSTSQQPIDPSDPVKPDSDSVKPDSDPVNPDSDSVKPGSDSVKPGSDSVKPGSDLTKPDSSQSNLGTNNNANSGQDKPDEYAHYNEMTQVSDELRAQTVVQTKEFIAKSPIIGHGLGFAIPLRPNGNEYTYLDMWNKVGIVGVVLFFSLTIYVIINMFRKIGHDTDGLVITFTWLSFVLGIMAYSVFNPYITSSLGVFALTSTMVISNLKYHKY